MFVLALRKQVRQKDNSESVHCLNAGLSTQRKGCSLTPMEHYIRSYHSAVLSDEIGLIM